MKTLIITFFILFSIKIYDSYFRSIDYRDTVCGNYASKRTYKFLNASNTVTATTTNFTVAVSKNAVDSMLNIDTQEGTFQVKLRGTNFFGVQRTFGKFSNDSIYMKFIPSLGPDAYTYIGKK